MNIAFENLVLCNRVIRDADTGNVTLFECLDTISSVTFPTMHRSFGVYARLRRLDDGDTVHVFFRLVRVSEDESEEVVATFDQEWAPDKRRTQLCLNFPYLRLLRPEVVRFRLDYHLGDSTAWVHSPPAYLDIKPMTMSAEEKARLRQQLVDSGLEVPPWLRTDD